MAVPSERSRQNPSVVWALLVLGVVLLAGAERGVRALSAGPWSPTGSARWIWAVTPEEAPAGTAFFVYRDFDLEGYAGRAQLSFRGDEEAFVYLNGTLLAAETLRDHGELSTYEVGFLLEPGANRIAAELRSGRGAGGFLLDLVVEGPHPTRVGTDLDWWVSRTYVDGLLVAGEPVPGAEPVEVRSRPDSGRGERPRAGGARRIFGDLVTAEEARHARWAQSERTADGWRPLGVPTVSSPPLGRTVTFDFGREMTGYANVVFGRKEGARALVFVGQEPPDPEADRPAAFLMNPIGRKSWSDARPRSFRYLTVVATAEMVGARVLPVVPRLAQSALTTAAPAEGVFGLESLGLRPPVENEIRSELERLASVAAGEGV